MQIFLSNISNTPSVPTSKPKIAYLEMALEALEKMEKIDSENIFLFGRVAKAIHPFKPKKAAEIFNKMFQSLNQLKNSDDDYKAKAYTIYTTQPPEKVREEIQSLKKSYASLIQLKSYISLFGKDDAGLVKLCREKFDSWVDVNDSDKTDFARSFADFDFDTYLELMKGVNRLTKRAEEIINRAVWKNVPLKKELVEEYIRLINSEFKQGRGTHELLGIKLRYCIFRGMDSTEIKEWKKEFQQWSKEIPTDDFIFSRAVEAFVNYIKKTHFEEALNLSLLLKDPTELDKELIAGISPEKLPLFEKHIEQLKDPQLPINDFIKVDYWLAIASEMATSYPQDTETLLEKLTQMTHQCPDSYELDFRMGMGKRSDAFVDLLDKKYGLYKVIAGLYLKLGKLDMAKNLLKNNISETKQPRAVYLHKMQLAEFYMKTDKTKAEKCYEKAYQLIPKIDSYEIAHEHLKNDVASGMFKLNSYRALAMATDIPDSLHPYHLLLDFVKESAKTDPQFAEKCVESMPKNNFYSKFCSDYPVKGYLELAESITD